MTILEIVSYLDAAVGKFHVPREDCAMEYGNYFYCDKLPSPEHDLWYAVLRKAVTDLQRDPPFYESKLGRGIATSEDFFNSQHCENVCDVLGVNYEGLIRTLKRGGYLGGVDDLGGGEAEDLGVPQAA